MRQKEKETTIDLEIMLQIKNEFPKLMDFYKFAGLTISRQDFYAVMRGDECHSDAVRVVELGLNKAKHIRDMSVEKMLKVICEQVKTNKNQGYSGVATDALRVVVADIYM